MEYQRKKFHELAVSDQIIQKRVEALEKAAAQWYLINTNNDVGINAACNGGTL